ncbi:GNAT family N-acetyltransferase [Histomonas meleagridis]|uniref:GNAT family N-acetyltransferase n=1 Tax=Histomonas meleagridis TaxID=135588 RepID=UPI00355A089C|nr:GNAT family N-acetyltransferase [Histomonas meleagridis]KAH0802784.1 GNAT family N-acetyltransferase [Histomonas meleagridis]
MIIKQVKTTEEINELAKLADTVWHEYFPCILSSEQIDYMVEKFQSVPALTDQLNNQGYRYFFLELDGTKIGYTGIKSEDGKLFLSKIYILKPYRGHGYASNTLQFLDDLCKKEGLKSIWLTVNKNNEPTIAVYKKKGFQTIRTQVADIGNGFVMDDYIMEKTVAA